MGAPEKIGRFKVIGELGRGSQGVVYLAEDPWLGRQVAIKTLDIHISAQRDRLMRLMHEARIVSRLQHPNIISVFDIGELQGKPYLVLEYVEGSSLKAIIKRDGPLDIRLAVSLMVQILSGIAYAHQHEVIHRDLNPSNIMVDKNDSSKIMDFGISVTFGARKDLAGTPCYMSPEHFSQAPLGPRSDIFSLGLVFYEMLTGRPSFWADNQIAVMYKIANEPLEPPSRKRKMIGPELDRIILKAVEKKPELRYGDALEMKQSLEAFLLSLDQSEWGLDGQQKEVHSTVDFLLRKMSRKKDFPAFSHHILEINKKACSSTENQASALQLANVVLKDFSLTSKLLRLVNSAFYGQFSGKITSVSRAVVLLGFEQVRMAVSSLMLFEHLQNKTQTIELKDGAVISFMSGLIARDLAKKAGMKGVEEAFICAMLHNIGKHMVMFYFPDEYGEIKTAIAQRGMIERGASRLVLGISYEDLGMAVLKAWNFPEKIISSIRSLPPGDVQTPKSETDLLRCLSNFSGEICKIISSTEEQDCLEALAALADRFRKSIPLSDKQLLRVLDSARKKIENYAETLGIDSQESEFLRRLNLLFMPQVEEEPAEGPKSTSGKQDSETPIKDGGRPKQTTTVPAEAEDELNTLINGIQEITGVLLGNYDLNDLMSMILETMYRGFGFNRVLFCVRDNQRSRMGGRFGFGDDAPQILGKFSFPLVSGSSDVFNLAISKGRDYIIEDIDEPILGSRIPKWYREAVNAPAFILYPLVVKNVGLGLFYADRNRKGPVITEGQKVSMETLRNHALFAITQKL